jgi:hypothetical protein
MTAIRKLAESSRPAERSEPWECAMSGNDIHVIQGESGSWLVTEGCWLAPIRVFRLQSHATAFASAVAWARGVEMLVHGPDGSQTRRLRASLTYPRELN